MVKKTKKKIKKKEFDYGMLLPIGIVFAGVSVVFITAINLALGISFLAVGGAYMIIGISKRKKKKK